MKNKSFKISGICLGMFSFLLPVIALGAEVTLTYPPFASAGSPAAFVSQLYNYALGIAGTLAIMMIVYGGIKYIVSSGNTSAQSDAKDIITSAIWGIVLLAGAYLVLSTINPEIVLLKDIELKTPAGAVGGDGGTTVIGPAGPPIADQDYRDYLKGFGINVKNPPCGQGQTETTDQCVDLGNMKAGTVQEIVDAKQLCGVSCDVVVTAGSGAGHNESGTYTHANGYKFDLRYSGQNDPLTQWIQANPKVSGSQVPYEIRSACSALNCYQTSSGSVYMFEGNHWDVTVVPKK